MAREWTAAGGSGKLGSIKEAGRKQDDWATYTGAEQCVAHSG